MTIRWPAGLVDESFDPGAEYAGELLDLSDTAIRTGFPGEPVFYVEVIYPKVMFRLGDLNIAFGRGADCDEPFDGYWADCWDDVTTLPMNAFFLTAPTMREVVALAAQTLIDRGLAQLARRSLRPSAQQREIIDKEVDVL